VSWPDQKIVLTTLSELADEVRRHQLTRTTLILVGPAIGRRQNRSQLYDPRHGHIFRTKSHEETHPTA
jgi:precorrin-4/cobalt-precorrin-4 C11-methyltransferase